MFAWLAKKAGFSVISSFLAPFKVWIMGAVIAAVVGYVGIHYLNDKNRKVDLRQAEGRIELLEADNKNQAETIEQKTALIAKLNKRIKDNNKRNLEVLERERSRVNAAQALAAEIRLERDAITSELADARFGILEATRDDEDFADWGYINFPAIGWAQLRDTAEGHGN